MSFAEDLSVFFSDFAVVASFAIAGMPKTARVNLECPAVEPFGAEVDATAPACIGTTEALGGLKRGSPITVDGKLYVVERSEPDGTGVTRLVLRGG
jgi:hypothetical protein